MIYDVKYKELVTIERTVRGTIKANSKEEAERLIETDSSLVQYQIPTNILEIHNPIFLEVLSIKEINKEENASRSDETKTKE